MRGLVDAYRNVVALVGFRALPCAVYAVGARSIRVLPRGGLALVTGLSLVALDRSGILELRTTATAYAYLIAITCAIPFLSRQLRAGRVTGGAVFVWCAWAYFVFPALICPSEATAAVVLVLGWDAMLSGYSYCIDMSKTRDTIALPDCMFFLLVNPALVYARRGERIGSPRLDARGAARMALAVVILFAVSAGLAPAYGVLRLYALRESREQAHVVIASAAMCGAMRFVIQYARQSALASLQIGLLRQLGHEVPERYVWPICAAGPADFFRRWNTYVGQWLLRYVFWPVSLHLGTATRSRSRRAFTTAFAVILTFIVCGCLHEAAIYGTRFVAETQMLQVFAVSGALVLASIGTSILWTKAELRSVRFAGRQLLYPLLSRAALWVSVVAAFFLWFP